MWTKNGSMRFTWCDIEPWGCVPLYADTTFTTEQIICIQLSREPVKPMCFSLWINPACQSNTTCGKSFIPNSIYSLVHCPYSIFKNKSTCSYIFCNPTSTWTKQEILCKIFSVLQCQLQYDIKYIDLERFSWFIIAPPPPLSLSSPTPWVFLIRRH